MQMQDLGPTLFLLSFIGVLVVPLPWNGKDEAAPAILPPPLAAPSTTLPEIPAAPKMPEPPVQVALAPEPAPEIKTGRRYSWKELECGALTGYGEARNKTHMHEAMAIKVLFNRAEETGQDICALAVRRDWDRRRRRWVNQFDGFWAVGCAPAFARGEVHFCEPGEKDAYARSRQLVQAVVEGKIELPPWNKRALFFTEHFDGFFKKLRAKGCELGWAGHHFFANLCKKPTSSIRVAARKPPRRFVRRKIPHKPAPVQPAAAFRFAWQ